MRSKSNFLIEGELSVYYVMSNGLIPFANCLVNDTGFLFSSVIMQTKCNAREITRSHSDKSY